MYDGDSMIIFQYFPIFRHWISWISLFRQVNFVDLDFYADLILYFCVQFYGNRPLILLLFFILSPRLLSFLHLRPHLPAHRFSSPAPFHIPYYPTYTTASLP